MSQKVCGSAREVPDGVTFDGMTVMSGGFDLAGNPENLIAALKEAGTRDLTVISNNCDVDHFDLRVLLNNGQIRKTIASYRAGSSLGMSGARLAPTAAHAMQKSGARRALVTMCVDVGQGVALEQI